jgi:hypothetical protein
MSTRTRWKKTALTGFLATGGVLGALTAPAHAQKVYNPGANRHWYAPPDKGRGKVPAYPAPDGPFPPVPSPRHGVPPFSRPIGSGPFIRPFPEPDRSAYIGSRGYIGSKGYSHGGPVDPTDRSRGNGGPVDPTDRSRGNGGPVDPTDRSRGNGGPVNTDTGSWQPPGSPQSNSGVHQPNEADLLPGRLNPLWRVTDPASAADGGGTDAGAPPRDFTQDRPALPDRPPAEPPRRIDGGTPDRPHPGPNPDVQPPPPPPLRHTPRPDLREFDLRGMGGPGLLNLPGAGQLSGTKFPDPRSPY